MTDSVTGSLLNGGAPRTSLGDLPAEMLWNICSHSDLVSLVRLSAMSHALRCQVHEIFTSRIEAQANKYPEVKQSLDRLGWKKEHNSSDCKCFQMMAGPGATWSELEEERSSSAVSNSNLLKTSTTVAGKTFFATTSGEVTYAEMTPGGGGGHNSLRTLITFNYVYSISLASHENVLAVILTKRFPGFTAGTVSVCIFNASTLEKVSEMNLCDHEDGLIVISRDIALTRDTMVVHNVYISLQPTESKIQIWKINTQDPQEEGMSLLHTMTPQTAPLSRYLPWYQLQSICINDRFTVIFDVVVKVFGGNGESPLVCQLEIGNIIMKTMAMQGGQGDHLALALISLNADNVPELTVKVYSSSQGNLIVQKEIGPFPWIYSTPFFMKWFGDHLTIGLQQGNRVSMFSWQPGLASFLNSPCGVPVVRRSPRGNRGGVAMWTANCLQVDFQGITTAVCNPQSEKVFFKTWKSAS